MDRYKGGILSVWKAQGQSATARVPRTQNSDTQATNDEILKACIHFGHYLLWSKIYEGGGGGGGSEGQHIAQERFKFTITGTTVSWDKLMRKGF